MALSAELGKAGITPDRIDTTATLTLDKVDAGWGVTGIHLQTNVKIASGDRAKVPAIAEAAKAGCPISRLLNTKITMEAKVL